VSNRKEKRVMAPGVKKTQQHQRRRDVIDAEEGGVEGEILIGGGASKSSKKNAIFRVYDRGQKKTADEKTSDLHGEEPIPPGRRGKLTICIPKKEENKGGGGKTIRQKKKGGLDHLRDAWTPKGG